MDEKIIEQPVLDSEEDSIELGVSKIKKFTSVQHIDIDFEEIKQQYEIYTPKYVINEIKKMLML